MTMASLLCAALSLGALASAVGVPRADTGSGIMKLPIARINRTDTSAKRQIDTGLANPEYGTIYIVSIEIGTPPQPISVQIDTGSSDLWVNPECSTSGSVAFCQSYPVYDPYTSSTALDTGYEMDLAYGKGSCSGEYLLDTVSLGGVPIKNQQFGWASSSTELPTGIMGISWGVELIGYYNIIDQLALQGITNSRAFSLDLGNVDTAEGAIIFGGIDTKKYSGSLEKRPIIPANEAPDGDRYWIYMTSVGNSIPSAASKIYTAPTYNQAVFLDSGGTLSRLPADLVAAMLADFPGYVDNGNGLYTVPCSYRSQAGTLDFGFGNTVIHVPYHEFIWMTGSTCVFGAVANAATDSDWVLGDTFLRSTYVVYDQDNRNLLLANSANCGENLVPIGTGANSVPSITGACPPAITTTSISSSATSTSTSKTATSSTRKTSTTTSKTTLSSTSTSTSKTTTSSTKISSITSSTSIKITTSSTKSSSSTSVSTTTTSRKASTTLSTTTTKTSTSASATATSTPPVINGYAYAGCFVDSSPHSLTKILANDSMTIELCIAVAHDSKPPYPYAGVEYGRECWAATTSPAAATPTSGSKACTMSCAGNARESCGGRNMFGLWAAEATLAP